MRGGHRCGWGWVGSQLTLGGVRGWQFWGRDEQPGGLEIRCCRLQLVSGLRGPDVLLTAYVDASNAIYGQELSCVGAMRLGVLRVDIATLWGAEKGGQTVSGVHVSGPNLADHLLQTTFLCLSRVYFSYR